MLFRTLYAKWDKDNPMGLNEALLAMKAYAPYHQLYGISVIFCEINKMNDSVPNPSIVLQKLNVAELLDTVVETAGNCLNMASLKIMPGGKQVLEQLNSNLEMRKEDFDSRWTAD